MTALIGSSQRPEGPHQQHERDQRDQQQDVRELVVDGAEVVLDRRTGPGDADRRRWLAPSTAVADGVDDRVLELSTVSSLGSTSMTRQPVLYAADDGQLHTVDGAAACHRCVGLVRRHQDVRSGSGRRRRRHRHLEGLQGRSYAGPLVASESMLGLADLEREHGQDEQARA